jgi:hypothetical protein
VICWEHEHIFLVGGKREICLVGATSFSRFRLKRNEVMTLAAAADQSFVYFFVVFLASLCIDHIELP